MGTGVEPVGCIRPKAVMHRGNVGMVHYGLRPNAPYTAFSVFQSIPPILHTSFHSAGSTG